MDATLGQAQRQTHRLVLFFVTIAAAALILGLAGGYGIRAWTSSSSTTATAAPASPTIVHPAPGPLPDRSDVSTARPTKLPDRTDISAGANNPTVVNPIGDTRIGGAR
jgi:hypothetical protein